MVKSDAIKLHPQTVEAIARRVIELLQTKETAPSPELIDAAELARCLGVDRSWVYTHAIELGAIKLGGGRRPRLRFDPKVAIRRFRNGVRTDGPQKRAPSQRLRRHKANAAARLLPIKGGGAS